MARCQAASAIRWLGRTTVDPDAMRCIMNTTEGASHGDEQRIWGVFQGDPRRTGALAPRVLPADRLRPGERESSRAGAAPPSKEREGPDGVREGAEAEAEILGVGPVHGPRKAARPTAPWTGSQELGDRQAT